MTTAWSITEDILPWLGFSAALVMVALVHLSNAVMGLLPDIRGKRDREVRLGFVDLAESALPQPPDDILALLGQTSP